MSLRLSLFAALVAAASACRCAIPDFPDCDKSTAIFGEVLSYEVTPCADSDGVNDYALAKVQLEAIYKQADGLNLSVGDTIVVRTAVQGATCGYPMQAGTSYLLFPTVVANPLCDLLETATNLQVSSCDGNKQSPTKQELAEYEEACANGGGNTCQQECESKCERRCERYCSWRGSHFG